MRWQRGGRTNLFIIIVIALLWQQGYFSLAAAQTAVWPPAPDPAPPAEETLFIDVSRAAGLVHTRRGDDRAIGQAWGDYDNDGWLDLYVTDTEGPNTLFRNQGDGTFAVSPQAGDVTLARAYSGGASFVDYDNDGWRDLYVVNWGENTLFHNEGGRRFVDVTAVAGVGDEANGQTASWGDYDNDGWLDLYVANWACYPRCGRPAHGDTDRLYHNNGDGSFTDVTALLNSKVLGSGFVASFVDYDNDGDLDIYLVNDEWINPIGNALWRNDGPGCEGWCFSEVSAAAGADTVVMGMGLASTDYDNDGDVDFYFSNAGPMTLLQNQEDGTFTNVAERAGVDLPTGVAWGAAPLDYDNDGWQDLYLAVMRTADSKGVPANALFHNNGDGSFTHIRSGSGASDVGPTMGVAVADYDRDGWQDLVIGNSNEGYRLLRNQGADFATSHWFSLELAGAGPVNADAVGTRVTIRTSATQTQGQTVQNGASLGAGNELALHFGLGPAAVISELIVTWPDGRMQRFNDVPADRHLTLPYPLDAAAEAAQLRALYPRPAAAGALSHNLLAVSFIIAAVAVLVIVSATRRHEHIRLPQPWQAWRRLSLPLLLSAGFIFLALLLALRPHALGAPAAALTGTSLSHLLDRAGVTPPQVAHAPAPELVTLGEGLFWDPLLSGNRDISCATCHHPDLGTGDGLSLSIGTGGAGLGFERKLGDRRELIPRNAPPVYNLGLAGMHTMFWDGRVRGTLATGYASPADDDLPFSLDNAVAAQAMFPVTSRDEMRGNRGDEDQSGRRNELATIDDHDWTGIWEALMARLLAVPAYNQLFQAAYPNIPLSELDFSHAANALAAYQMAAFTFLDSPWDRYLLQGEAAALDGEALAGARLFYGKAGCAQCHSGPLLSDMQFHNVAVPQVGPGKGNEQPLDFGRERETGDPADRFAFRTPPLRNVALTGPWMHNGAFTSLETAVRYHLHPATAWEAYDTNQLTAVMQAATVADPAVRGAAAEATSVFSAAVDLSDTEVASLLAFLHALTSPSAVDLAHTIPNSVPSGLAVGGS